MYESGEGVVVMASAAGVAVGVTGSGVATGAAWPTLPASSRMPGPVPLGVGDPSRTRAGVGLGRAAVRPGVRLTPRGRIALVLLLAVVGAVGVTALPDPTIDDVRVQAAGQAVTVSDAVPGASMAALGLAEVHQVQQGETLWSIATDLVGEGDPRRMVFRLQQINGMEGSALQVGQELWIPRAK